MPLLGLLQNIGTRALRQICSIVGAIPRNRPTEGRKHGFAPTLKNSVRQKDGSVLRLKLARTPSGAFHQTCLWACLAQRTGDIFQQSSIMKKIILFFLFFILVSFSGFAEDKTDFEKFYPEALPTLEKHHFWSDVKTKQGSSGIHAAMRAWYPYPAEKVFEVITNVNRFPLIHKNYKEAFTISLETFEEVSEKKPKTFKELSLILKDKKIPPFSERKKKEEWKSFVYLNMDFPWPISNRWMIQKIEVDESDARKDRYRYVYKMKLGTFKTLKGYWELLPIPGKSGWTEFRSIYEPNPGVSVPDFMVRQAMKIGLKRDFEENKKALAK